MGGGAVVSVAAAVIKMRELPRVKLLGLSPPLTAERAERKKKRKR